MEAKFDLPFLEGKKVNDKIPFKIRLRINETSLILFVDCQDHEIKKFTTGPSENGKKLAYRKIGTSSIGSYAGRSRTDIIRSYL